MQISNQEVPTVGRLPNSCMITKRVDSPNVPMGPIGSIGRGIGFSIVSTHYYRDTSNFVNILYIYNIYIIPLGIFSLESEPSGDL